MLIFLCSRFDLSFKKKVLFITACTQHSKLSKWSYKQGYSEGYTHNTKHRSFPRSTQVYFVIHRISSRPFFSIQANFSMQVTEVLPTILYNKLFSIFSIHKVPVFSSKTNSIIERGFHPCCLHHILISGGTDHLIGKQKIPDRSISRFHDSVLFPPPYVFLFLFISLPEDRIR